MEWIQCLWSNVVNPLFVTKSKLINDRREQTMPLHTSELVLIRLSFVQKRTDLHQTTGRFEENTVRVLELSFSSKSAFMEQCVLNVNSTQPTVPSSSSNNKKWF